MDVLGELLQRLIELSGLSDTQVKVLGIIVTLGIFLIGIGLALYARYVIRRNHRMRRFHQQVVIQRHVHSRQGDAAVMSIRTIWSGTLDEIFGHDPLMQDKIVAAARKTTVKNPFIILGDEDLQSIMLQTYVNFTGWKLPEDAEVYALSPTAEPDAGRSRKIRVLLLEDGEDGSQVDMYFDNALTIKAQNEKLQGPRVNVLRLLAAAATNGGRHGNDVVSHPVSPAWAEADDSFIY